MAATSRAARRPIEGRTAIAAAIRAVRIWLAAVLIASAAVTAAYAAGGAAPAAKSAKTSAETAPPSEIQALLSLLADPKVQAWLMQQDKTESAAAPPAKPERDSPAEVMSSRVEAVRDHITAMTEAIPGMPAEFEHAKHVFDERLGDRRPGKILTLVAAFVGLGFGVDALFRRATRRIRENLDDHPVETVGDRVRVVAERAAFALGSVVAFALGSIGAFLAFHWPGLLRDIVLGYLIVFLAVRFTAVLGRFLLAPYNERFRVIPMDTAAARYWHLRWRLIVGWIVFGVGYPRHRGDARHFSGDGRHRRRRLWFQLARDPDGSRVAPTGRDQRRNSARKSTFEPGQAECAADCRSCAAVGAARGGGDAGLLAARGRHCLAARRSVDPARGRAPAATAGHAPKFAGTPTLTTVFLERGLRAVLIIGAIAVLAWGWGIDIESLAGRETMMTRIAHGALSAVAIALIADFVWHVAKAAIDIKLAETADLGLPNSDEARRRARLRTLLPIFRNILFVVVVVVAIMMGLSAMGVEIGPLIAGASVLGVAIGFGAQSLVRDVIAGVFYLLDDAFRVGEYIQSGNYKGTVESFSFRSVRLRHQRGAVYTVPFSLLGAVQNQSRDWVIDKLTVGITYDSDIERARKLIKQIGLELAEEPEFKPLILEPLKMQGVDAFGDFAVQIRMKMMTLPGENFVIRRQALARIKKAFDANGIKFAYPTVQLAGDGEASAAAVAQQALQLTHPTAAAAE